LLSGRVNGVGDTDVTDVDLRRLVSAGVLPVRLMARQWSAAGWEGMLPIGRGGP
jgi:hypothetical protein